MDEEPFEHEEADQELDEDHFEAELDEVSDQTIDEIYSQLQLHDHHVTRTSSDTMPASGEVPAKLPKKMKKSANTKSPFSHFAVEDIVESRRPATVKEKKTKVNHEDDEEVDAKADDFINRFKQQLSKVPLNYYPNRFFLLWTSVNYEIISISLQFKFCGSEETT